MLKQPFLYASLIGLLVGGCSLSPEMKTPAMDVADNYHETRVEDLGSWKEAKLHAPSATTEWWTIYNDAGLNALQTQVTSASPSLQAAAARLVQAQALSRQTFASVSPTLGVNGIIGRQDAGAASRPQSNISVMGSLSYEASSLLTLTDTKRLAAATADEAQSLYAQAQLMARAMMTENYFLLRQLQEEEQLLQETVNSRNESLKLVETRYKLGETDQQDMLRARAEAETASAALAQTKQNIATTHHTLALLAGQMPGQLKLADERLPIDVPLIPAGVPSDVLQQRPDIQAVLQRLAGNNARIGLARRAYFPSITLTAMGGFGAPDLNDVFKWSSRAWFLGPLFGPAITMPLFDGGRRAAELDIAKGRVAETTADYKSTVLTAFKEVEDALAATRFQAEQEQHVAAAAHDAAQAAKIAKMRYEEGEIAYLDLLQTQRDKLEAKRALIRVHAARLVTSVQMIRALGGAWEETTPAMQKETKKKAPPADGGAEKTI